MAGGSLTALSLAVMAVIGWASGLGFGWLFTLGTANVVRSLDVAADAAGAGHRPGRHSARAGRPHHRRAVADPCDRRALIAVLVTWLLLAVLRGRLHPVGGLGVALGATVLLFPVVQPWYLLWAIIPLAAWATRPGFRSTTIAVTLVVGIFGPTANGDRFASSRSSSRRGERRHRGAADGVTYYRLPWRKLPDPGERPRGPAHSGRLRHHPQATDAYAESP